MREWFSKLCGLFRRGKIAGDLREEMDAHFEMKVRENLARGLSREEAIAAARLDFGSPALVQERAMDSWAFHLWETLWRDIRYAARALSRTPAFTAAAVLSLAVGIGAGTAIFSLMNALLWREMPVFDPGRLVLVWPREGALPHSDFAFYHSMFLQFRERSTVFSGVSATGLIDRSNAILDGNGANAGPLHAGMVSGDYFTTLGVQAAVGRTFSPDDDRVPGGSPVVVISYRFWQGKFSSAADVVGRTLRLNQTIFTVIGVAAPGFRGDWTGRSIDLWFPFTMAGVVMPEVPWASPHPVRVIARLGDGVKASQAEAASTLLYQQMLTERVAATTPELSRQIARQRIELQPAGAGYSPQRDVLATPVTILTVLSVLILLAACANVANLVLARSLARQREMAVRVAIGAGRMRIARQILMETMLLAVAGGLAGMVLASISTGGLSALLASGPASMRSDGAASSIVSVTPGLYRDLRVFGFTALLCMLAGVGFGLAPALMVSKAALAPALGDRGAIGGGGRIRRSLVAVQVALSMILLCGAAMFLRTLDNLRGQDLGFDRDHILMAYVDASQTGRPVPALFSLYQTLLPQMLTLPGVRSASIGPLLTGSTRGGDSETFHIEGHAPKPGLVVAGGAVTPGFFATVGTPLLAGRDFTARDTAGGQRVGILDQTMARFFFGDENPIGKHMGAENDAGYPIEIIGVVKDQKVGTVRDRRGHSWVPYAQKPDSLRAPWCLVVRTAADPRSAVSAVRQRLREIDPALPVFSLSSVAEHLDDTLSQERLLMILSVSFALMATVLACIGLYGVIAYATAQRMREFGIRIALGATGGGLRTMVLKDSLLLAMVGIAAGIPLAVVGARGASAMLFGVAPVDVRVFAAAAAILAFVAAAAGFIPAVRASRVHPSDALRHD